MDKDELPADLRRVRLIDGLPTELGGRALTYRAVILREFTVADELQATRLAERPAWAGGNWHLLLSEPFYDCALAALGIERFTGLGVGAGHDLTDVDLAVLGKLSPLDLRRIEQGQALLELSARYRHGLITQEQWQAALGRRTPDEDGAVGEPLGPDQALGSAPRPPGPGLTHTDHRAGADTPPPAPGPGPSGIEMMNDE